MLLLIGLALCAYFLPAIIAVNRSRHNKGAICLLNLLLGWTFHAYPVSTHTY